MMCGAMLSMSMIWSITGSTAGPALKWCGWASRPPSRTMGALPVGGASGSRVSRGASVNGAGHLAGPSHRTAGSTAGSTAGGGEILRLFPNMAYSAIAVRQLDTDPVETAASWLDISPYVMSRTAGVILCRLATMALRLGPNEDPGMVWACGG